jgi:hypothetical protein
MDSKFRTTYLVGVLNCLSIFFLAFSVCSAAYGQVASSRSVKLTGSVLAVKPHYVARVGDKNKYDFDIELYLQFKNDTDKPIIIFNPQGFYGQKKISFFEQVARVPDSKETSAVIPWKNPYQDRDYYYDPFASFLRWLYSSTKPSTYNNPIIDVGGYYECIETLRVSTGYRIKSVPGPKPYDIPTLFAVPEYASLRLEYFLSVRDRHEYPDALETAKRAWQEYGDLVLDSDGDYRVTSEIILNKLSD